MADRIGRIAMLIMGVTALLALVTTPGERQRPRADHQG